ncbi:hypothetical protein [Sulfurimonas sp.]|uniref:hypothetical protein n=1 Tax=Sulfurimonas sp. TaxID=2022749 RepID=UPI00260BFA8C|nr:hypothetical protein [Sulfurimonas sp.]
MIHKFKKFSKNIGRGLKQEYKETKEIPKHIKNREYKKAGEQIGDIGKMTFLSALWILPGGGIVSTTLVKFFKKLRPSSFVQEKEED